MCSHFHRPLLPRSPIATSSLSISWRASGSKKFFPSSATPPTSLWPAGSS
jgi:hypothetical protein